MFGDNQSSTNGRPSARPWLVLAAAFAIGLLFNYLAFGKLPGVGLSLWFMIVSTSITWLALSSKMIISRTAQWFLILSAGFAIMLMIRTSYELTFLNIVMVVGLWMLVAKELLGDRIREYVIERFAGLIWLPMYFLGNVGVFFRDWYRQRTGGKNGTGGQVTRGILLALPVIIIFALLFASADLVFRKYANQVIHLSWSTETWLRLVIVTVLTLGFMGAFWYVFGAERKPPKVTIQFKGSNFGRIETGIFLGTVNLLFLLFVSVQLTYLFGGQQNIVEQGFTYAEYARRGFFELIVVALISWLLVWTFNRSLIQSDSPARTLARRLSWLLILQVFVIMTSAFMRLVLYEQAYGFTTMRFYSHVFIMWLAVIFAALIVRLWSKWREETMTFVLLGSIIAFAAGVNLFNPDAFIAKQNIARYQKAGKVDVPYLGLLSDDAIPVISQLLDDQDETVRRTVAHDLYQHFIWLESSRTRDDWRSYNYARRRSRDILTQHRQLLDANQDFTPPADQTQGQSSVD